MNATVEKSANEVETLVLKAARGGGLPIGLAEDLAAAARYLDLDALTVCPCHGTNPPAAHIPSALDHVVAGADAITVSGDRALIAAYVAALKAQTGHAVTLEDGENGVTIRRAADPQGPPPHPLGRRMLGQDLAAHLDDMASKTLVPETESSRLGGAGAGLTDND